jgi:hypothetical protein
MREMLERRRARLVLFWVTVGLIAVVAVIAVTTILRQFRGPAAPSEPLLVQPGEATVCTGQQLRFAASAERVVWTGSGGTIGADGLFVAGPEPGDFTVGAADEESGRTTQVPVRVVFCTPTPGQDTVSTAAPTAPPTQPPTPTPQALVPVQDAQGDIGTYETGAATDGAPTGIDVRSCSVGSDLRVVLQPSAEVPDELRAWVAEGEALLWITGYDPVPDPPQAYTDWLFALDLDGNSGTGRAPGQARINPDLGDDAAIGVSYDATSEKYVGYFLVWSPQEDGWSTGPAQVRHYFSGDRRLVAFALPLQTLVDTVAQTSGIAVDAARVRGRAAILSYAGDQAVIDFCPDRPE